MNTSMRRSLAAALLSLLSVAAFAQAWPSRPIIMVTSFAAGSGPDIMARELANRLAEALKTPVVVDNKTGASGIPATQAVMRATPDGHTLYYTSATVVSQAPALIKNIPYDTLKDLTPISMTTAGGVVLMVNKDMPIRNFKELIDYARANPGMTYGSWAIGSSGHLIMEWIVKQTGVKMTHVPYRQSPQMMTELTSGELKVAWGDPSTPVPFIEAGKVRALVVSGVSRMPKLPDTPTMTEAGLPFETYGWLGVFAPKNVPQPIIDRLSTEIAKIQAQPEMIAKQASINYPRPPSLTPQQFKAYLEKEVATWRGIVQEARIQQD